MQIQVALRTSAERARILTKRPATRPSQKGKRWRGSGRLRMH